MRRDETSTFRSSSSFPSMFVLLLSSPVALLLKATVHVWLGAAGHLKLFYPLAGSTT